MSKEAFALLNAVLNGTSAVLLLAGYFAIRRQNYRTHGYLMASTLLTSGVFLVSYLLSHYLHGERSSGLGIRPITLFYFGLLITHVLLAIGMLPLIFRTAWLAYKRDWPRHRRIATPTFWIWLYVSVTGVVIYWMLYHLFPSIKASGA